MPYMASKCKFLTTAAILLTSSAGKGIRFG